MISEVSKSKESSLYGTKTKLRKECGQKKGVKRPRTAQAEQSSDFQSRKKKVDKKETKKAIGKQVFNKQLQA